MGSVLRQTLSTAHLILITKRITTTTTRNKITNSSSSSSSLKKSAAESANRMQVIEREGWIPNKLEASNFCAKQCETTRDALRTLLMMTEQESERCFRKYEELESLSVAREIVPRINYLKFLEARERLGDEDVKSFVIRQPRCLERKFMVLYEDRTSGFVALNKPFDVRLDTPRGWPGKQRFDPKFDGDASCEDFLIEQYPEDHVRFCHQLDNATSGVLLCAFTKKAAAVAAKMFRDRTTKKFYSAIVFGHPERDSWVNESKIGKDENDESGFRECVRVDDKGKECKTEITVVKRGYCNLEGAHYNKPVTLLRVQIFTGRRHQIRVHLQKDGHPILGDAAYANDEDTFRTFLHAEDLELFHSDKNAVCGAPMLKLHAPVPKSFFEAVRD